MIGGDLITAHSGGCLFLEDFNLTAPSRLRTEKTEKQRDNGEWREQSKGPDEMMHLPSIIKGIYRC